LFDKLPRAKVPQLAQLQLHLPARLALHLPRARSQLAVPRAQCRAATATAAWFADTVPTVIGDPRPSLFAAPSLKARVKARAAASLPVVVARLPKLPAVVAA